MAINIKTLGAGIAFLCDEQGQILEIIHNGLGVEDVFVPGQMLNRVVDRESFSKLLNFLVELRAQDAAFDWQLNVPLGDQVTSLHFTGVKSDEQFLIVAAYTRDNVMQLYEELMQISNEQMNKLRDTIKKLTQKTQASDVQDQAQYDELTRLNNELTNLQRELAKKNVELAHLNEQKNHFLGMAAHDLRNPLGAIQMYSEFLLEEAVGDLSDEHYEFLSNIHAASQFMLRLVEDLLDIATIESGELNLNLWPTDLMALITKNVNLNKVLASRKDITLVLHAEGEFPDLLIDAAKIEQVFNNLLSNAVKFSYPGSTVDVAVTQVKDNVQIAVTDEGQGIPEEELDKLFKPFGRTTVQSTGGEKSSGLGLAIARKIVEGHGGNITVESEVGKGTTFFVSLPLEMKEGSL